MVDQARCIYPPLGKAFKKQTKKLKIKEKTSRTLKSFKTRVTYIKKIRFFDESIYIGKITISKLTKNKAIY